MVQVKYRYKKVNPSMYDIGNVVHSYNSLVIPMAARQISEFLHTPQGTIHL